MEVTGPPLQIFTAICALHPSTRSFARNHLVLSAALLALARAAPAPSASTPALPPNWFSIVHLACDRGEEAVHAAAGEALRAVSSAVDCSGEVDRCALSLPASVNEVKLTRSRVQAPR